MAENGRYWQLEGENASAQMVDNVVTDLTDILHDGPPVGEDEKIAIVWKEGDPTAEEGSKEARDHFELGEAGGKTIIPGEEDRLVAADGQGNAKANSGYLFSKISSIGNFPSASLLESKLPAMKIELTGTNSTEDYWGNSHSGILAMTQNPLVQFLGDAIKGSPILSMRGKGIIDIDGGTQSHTNGTRQKTGSSSQIPWMSEQAYNYYSNTASPFFPFTKYMSQDGLIYPYFMMKESATALLEGSSLMHICGGSSLFMDGNADVRITGGYANGGSLYQQGRTFVGIDPGSTVIMSPLYYDSDDHQEKLSQYTPVFIVTPGANNQKGQLIISAQGEWHNASSYGSYKNYQHSTIYHTVDNDGINHVLDFTSGGGSFLRRDRQYRFVRSKLSFNAPNLRELNDMLQGVKQPSIMLQGKTNFIIGDNGTVGVRMGAQNSGQIGIDWTTEGNVGIKMGSGTGAVGVYEIVPADNSLTHFKFGPNEDCYSAIAIEPHGIFSYKVAPEAVCGISFTPTFTDIVGQWHAFEGTFEGKQVYAQVEGNSHFEFLDDSTVIMRGPSTYGWDAYTSTNSSAEEAIRVTSPINCDGFTYEQFWETLTDEQKEEVLQFLTPNFSSKGKVIISGTVTATEHYADKYHIVVEGATVPKQTGTASYSYNFTVTKRNTYSWDAATVMSWQEFKDAVKIDFGENAVVSDVTVQNIYSRSWGYEHRIQASVTNASSSCNSVTEYAIGTSYEDLTDEEKDQLRSGYGKLDWDFSAATVVSNGIRSDMIYDNVCQNYTYKTGTHLCQDWVDPVYAKTGPVTQMYGLSNFCMRGNLQVKDSNKNSIQSQYINTFTITPTETYDFSKTRPELINDLINGADYTELKRQIEGFLSVNTHYHFDHIYSVSEGEENRINVSVVFEYKKIEHKENLAPLVEIIGNTEIRIANGISITTENIDGESAIKIAAPEGEVSFTLSELKALKNLIANT